MTDALSLRQLNRTFIGSVLFIDIVGYSRRTVPEQLEMKELFNTLLQDAVQNVAPADRIMVDTGDGAAIAFLGDPEDALFAALSLRDAIDAGRAAAVGEAGFVRMGINLGPLKIVRDINGHTNMIGDGVNDAQRVMSFADAGQVMVSHSYFDIISRFSHDYAQLFVYEGTRQDKHVREHEVYRFGPVDGNAGLADKLRDRSRARANEADVPTAPKSAGKAAVKGLATGAKASRAGLIAAGIGALTLAGAVWSWSSRAPEQPHAADATPTQHPAVAASSTGETDPIAQIAASASAAAASEKKSAAPASGKAEDARLAAKATESA
ncbi:adenylate/guanylate cyclase domain-containing protein, partial [Oxalobacteraceae bacterium OM1]